MIEELMSTEIIDLVKLIAVIVGIASGAYALFQNYRKDAATKDAEHATKELRDKAAGIDAFEKAIKSQGDVIARLTDGLEQCIERDNTKSQAIEQLEREHRNCMREIEKLHSRVALLEGNRGT